MTCTILYVAHLINFPAPTFFYCGCLTQNQQKTAAFARVMDGTSFTLPIRLQKPTSFRQKDHYWWHATCGHAEFVGLYGRTECVTSKFTGIDCSKSDPGMFDDVCEHACFLFSFQPHASGKCQTPKPRRIPAADHPCQPATCM